MCEIIWKNLEEKNIKLTARNKLFIMAVVLVISVSVFAISLLLSAMAGFAFKYVLTGTGYGAIIAYIYALIWLYNRK